MIGIEDSEITENQRVVDCRRGPPNYEESQEYIKQIKEDLGIEVKTHVYCIFVITYIVMIFALETNLCRFHG